MMRDPQSTDAPERVAALDLGECIACGKLCELTGSFTLPGLRGLERYARTRCIEGHVMVGPEFALRPAS